MDMRSSNLAVTALLLGVKQINVGAINSS